MDPFETVCDHMLLYSTICNCRKLNETIFEHLKLMKPFKCICNHMEPKVATSYHMPSYATMSKYMEP